MHVLQNASDKIAGLIEVLKTCGGLEIHANIVPVSRGSAPGQPELIVELSGNDAPLLLDKNAELLQAIQHIAASVLRLELEEHDRVWFDVNKAKADRKSELYRLAELAVARVRETASAYEFPPMMACERHLLRVALAPSGLKSASVGVSLNRRVVLYPEGADPPVEPLSPSDLSGPDRGEIRVA